MAWERLTGRDLAMLWPDDLGWPQEIGVLATLDGEAVCDPMGGLAVTELRDRIANRLHLVPRFRQCLHRPGLGQGPPYWADDQSFDIARHVRVHDLPEPGTESQLLAACEEIRRRRFDSSRPLWEFWFINALAEGRVALFIRVHHTLADGAAGVAALTAFLDPAPDMAAAACPHWNPDPAPTPIELMQDNLRRRWKQLRRKLGRLFHPVALSKRFLTAMSAVKRILEETRAPRTSLNRPIGDGRMLAVVRSELSTLKDDARAVGATVNDVLLNAVAGGLRELLAGRGEPIDGLLPRAVVPIAGGLDTESGNNTASGMLVPLPIGDSDVLRRLRKIRAETAERKKNPLSYDEAGLLSSPTMERISARLAARQRVSNVYVANLPGPPVRLYFGPAQVVELFPVVPLIGNTTIGVGALSYAGQFNLTVVVDHDACPDVDVFVRGLRDSLHQMSAKAARTPG